MISGFCAAGRALNRQDYISTAIKAADFIMKHMVDTANGKLLRSCYGNGAHALEQLNPPIHGFIDDYAFFIQVKFKIYIFFRTDFVSFWKIKSAHIS